MKSCKRLLFSSFLTAALLTASACTGTGSNETAPSQIKEQNTNREPVEITFYRPNTGTTEEQFMDLMGKKIKEKFPFVTPKFIPFGTGTSVNEVIASGQPLDIVILSIGFVPQFHNLNLSTELDDLIKKHKYDINRLEATTFDFVKQFGNGKVTFLPIFTTAHTLMYNKDIFDRFGVPYPTEGMTWDDIYELSKKLSRTDGGTKYYGFLTSVGHMMRTNQLALSFVDPKTQQPLTGSEKFKQLVENFARFYNMPGSELPKEKYGKEADMFLKERTLAMYAYFNSTMVSAPADLNMEAVLLPSFKEAPGVGSQMYPTFASVSSTSKNKDVAFEILAYLTSDEMQTKFAKDALGMPIVKNSSNIMESFGADIATLKGKNLKGFYPVKPAAIAPKTIYDDLAEKHLTTAFREYAQGASDVNTALRKAVESAVKDIEAAKQK